MVAYLKRMPSGIPGDVSRKQTTDVDSIPADLTVQFPGYGLPGKLLAGLFSPIVAGDTAASVFGFLVRPYPVTSPDAAGLTVSLGGVKSVMRRGYMTVKNNNGTPARGGAVYVRVAAGTTLKPIGGLEAVVDATPANTLVIPRTYFTGPADANGNVEIEYLIGA